MPNNVFDVLYLNLYGYLHYSYFPGLGTNPFDMEMGCSVSWQSWGEREGERARQRGREREFPGLLLLKMCWKQIFRILWLHGIGYRGLHKPLKAQQWAVLFNQQKVLHAGHILHTREVNQIMSIFRLCQAPSAHMTLYQRHERLLFSFFFKAGINCVENCKKKIKLSLVFILI